VGDGVHVERMWYSFNYDRNIIMTAEGDMDVRMMLKGMMNMGIYIWVARTICNVI